MLSSPQSERELLYSQIENEYAHVVYSHTTQEEERSRLEKINRRIELAQIVLSALSSAGFIGIFVTQEPWIAPTAAVLTFLLLILNSLNFRLELDTRVVRHRRAGDQLWLVVRKYLSLLVDFSSLETSEIRSRRDALLEQTDEVYKNAQRTDGKSFAAAQRRLKKEGLKELTREELNSLLPEALQR